MSWPLLGRTSNPTVAGSNPTRGAWLHVYNVVLLSMVGVRHMLMSE